MLLSASGFGQRALTDCRVTPCVCRAYLSDDATIAEVIDRAADVVSLGRSPASDVAVASSTLTDIPSEAVRPLHRTVFDAS